MVAFGGVPRDTRYTPVPNLLFTVLLEEMDDSAELKCVLRFLWLAYQRKGFPRTVPEEEVVADRVLLRALGSVEEVRRGVGRAVERGVLLRGRGPDGGPALALHMEGLDDVLQPVPTPTGQAEVETPAVPRQRPNVFALYEQNIGMLTPLLADELREAEQTYPLEWIEDAFKEAVERNKRSWRYIESILKRWAIEGREHGEPGRHPQKITAEEYIRRHGLRG